MRDSPLSLLSKLPLIECRKLASKPKIMYTRIYIFYLRIIASMYDMHRGIPAVRKLTINPK